jgi:hypothetical protein
VEGKDAERARKMGQGVRKRAGSHGWRSREGQSGWNRTRIGHAGRKRRSLLANREKGE